MFYNQYFSEAIQLAKWNEFLTLRQINSMTVLEYANRFNELGHFCPQLIQSDQSKANQFEQDLRYGIRTCLSSHLFCSYRDVLGRALKVEAELKRSEQECGDSKIPRSGRNSQDKQKNPKKVYPEAKKETPPCPHCQKRLRGLLSLCDRHLERRDNLI